MEIHPPAPAERAVSYTHHADTRIDPYAWLGDSSDPQVIAHLEAENAYAEAATAALAPLRAAIFEEIKGRTQQSDLSVPVAYRGWWYYTRTTEGHQYPAHARVPVTTGQRPVLVPGQVPEGEQVLVDGDLEAGEHPFFALGALEVSNDGAAVAVAVDVTGDERFDVRIRRIETGEQLDVELTGVGYGLAWSGDDRFIFYTRLDEAWRPFQLWRHEVGTATADDVLVLEESDERFWMGIETSRDDRFLVVQLASRTTSEVHLLDLADPVGPLRVVAPRTSGVEYEVEPAGDIVLITHNTDRSDFELSWAPLSDPGPANWRPWLQPVDGERVLGAEAFQGHVAVSLRRNGLTSVRIVPRVVGSGGEHGQPWDLPVQEELYTISTGANPDWTSGVLQVVLESFITPRAILEYDLASRQATLLKRQPVLGGFDPSHYQQHRVWVQAEDGTQVPMSVVARADVQPDASAAGLLYGYGAYEIPMDPHFSVAMLSMLDRGVVFAVAHVRGGGEMGRRWYEEGRLANKPNSFTDLISCARALFDTGWVAPGRLALEGGSAGGLLVGAALNLAPELFCAVHAAVPFVDALSTILDPSRPLTVGEWDEWGNPLEDPKIYEVMKSYTPYENIRAVEYPAILATSGLNDTRVDVGEPAKWVARLRKTVTSDQNARPILLRTEMVAGHGGRSGRYDAWHDAAWELAFLLDHLGLGATEAS
ncbi:S9 family peptidase [Gephyromycinifex aptenodytis]|uniref:S9 family peptidase n=1 Tax=Gephyromycinifex aptenodytis TaxID=2716227 RepID=UPI001444F64A|nr:S9 family peptidase [Gephyromycinifex aptenodytis]